MAKVWAAMKFTARDGNTYQVDDPVDLPRNTDEEKSEFDRLREYGIITDRRPTPTEDDDQRTPRQRRAD